MTKPTLGILTAGLMLALTACSQSNGGAGDTTKAGGTSAGGNANPTLAAPSGANAGERAGASSGDAAGGAPAGSAAMTTTDSTAAQSMTLGSRGPAPDATPIPPSAPRAEDDGDRHVAQPAEAMKAVPFKMLGINALPKDSAMDVLFVITPREGETKPNLPAIRMIYTWGASGAIVLYQSPATGQFPAGGEPLDINGHQGQFYTGQMSTEILEWEQDGVHVQLRGTGPIDRATLLEAAKSVGPYQEKSS